MVKRTFESLFVDAWQTYLSQARQNQANLELRKLERAFFTQAATETTQMELDGELAADRPHLQALIKKQTQEETKALQRELQSLRSQVSSLKNLTRGRSEGASNKKTNSRASTTRRGKK